MPVWLTNLLVDLAYTTLEKLVLKGSHAYDKLQSFKAELDANRGAVIAYQKVVSDPNTSRDARRKAEDELGK